MSLCLQSHLGRTKLKKCRGLEWSLPIACRTPILAIAISGYGVAGVTKVVVRSLENQHLSCWSGT
jgi:hypothetical protein